MYMGGWLGYVETMTELHRNDNEQLPDKMTTLYKYDVEVKRLKFIFTVRHSE